MPDGSRPKSIYTLGEDEGGLITINPLIYGYSGVGKTPLWATAGKELLLMDSDYGVESAESMGLSCDVVPVTTFKELSDVYQFLRYGTHSYRWVAWDGLTLFMDRVLVDELVPDAHAQNPKQSADVASQREYLILQNRVSDYVRRFRSLPINFGISALVMTAEDPDGNLLYVPFLPGKKGEFSSKISGYMNIVGYYGITPKGTRRLLTERHGYYMARDKFHAVRTVTSKGSKGWLDNPTIPQLEKLIDEKRKHGKDQASGRQGSRRTGRVRR